MSIEELRAALDDELSLPTSARMLEAFGGIEHCLSRFLEARASNVTEAAAMFQATACFRRENGLDGGDALPQLSDDLKERMESIWPGAYSGFSADNSPVMFFRFGSVDLRRAMDTATEEEIRQFYLHWMERGLALQKEGSTRAAAVAGTTTADSDGDGGDATALSCRRGMIEVYDAGGLAVSSVYIPGIRLFARVLGLGQDHYPQNLRKCFIVNAPLGFQSCAAHPLNPRPYLPKRSRACLSWRPQRDG